MHIQPLYAAPQHASEQVAMCGSGRPGGETLPLPLLRLSLPPSQTPEATAPCYRGRGDAL